MAKEKKTNSELEIEKVKSKRVEKHLFQEWLCLTRKQRKMKGYPITIDGFAKKYDIRRQKLHEWKNDESFLKQTALYRKRMILDEMPEVIDSVINKAKKTGSESAFKTLAEYAGDYKQEVELGVSGELSDLFKELQEGIKKK